jgi:hypothetical protein
LFSVRRRTPADYATSNYDKNTDRSLKRKSLSCSGETGPAPKLNLEDLRTDGVITRNFVLHENEHQVLRDAGIQLIFGKVRGRLTGGSARFPPGVLNF